MIIAFGLPGDFGSLSLAPEGSLGVQVTTATKLDVKLCSCERAYAPVHAVRGQDFHVKYGSCAVVLYTLPLRAARRVWFHELSS